MRNSSWINRKNSFYSDICSWWYLRSFKAETKLTMNYNNHNNNNNKSTLGLFPNSCFGMGCLLLSSCATALLGSDKEHTASCTLKCTRNRKRDMVPQKEIGWLQAFSRADWFNIQEFDVPLQTKGRFSILPDCQKLNLLVVIQTSLF